MKNLFSIDEINLIAFPKTVKTNSKLIIILLLIGITVILCKFKFYTYQKVSLIKNNDNYLIISSINNEDKIIENKYLYIKDKKYKYKVLNISDNYNSYDNIPIEEINIEISNLKKKNKLLEASILLDEETIIDMVYKFIKGG